MSAAARPPEAHALPTGGSAQRPNGRDHPVVAHLLAGACGWAAFLPVGGKYLALLGCALAAAVILARQGRLPELLRDAAFRTAAAFWLLTVASAAWSTGSPALIAAQCGLYALLLIPPAMALAFAPDLARRALGQFGAAAATVGALVALERLGALPASALWASTVQAEGNQRIVTSLVLALGAAVCIAHALAAAPGSTTASTSTRARAAWLAAALLALLGLALQDRRTGMVALPMLLAVLGLARLRGTRQRVAVVLGVVALSLAAWQFAPGVRHRIDEGLHELRAYQSTDAAATSWGMRLRLAEHTLDMVREAPLLGHGVGSWLSQWQSRVQPGLLISVHTTPHNEYLLVAAQLGAAGLALLAVLLAVNLQRAWRAGPAGHIALLAWTAIAWTGLFNVVLRDSKFALPMLLVAGWAGVVARGVLTDKVPGHG